jgi:hypothetical protein
MATPSYPDEEPRYFRLCLIQASRGFSEDPVPFLLGPLLWRASGKDKHAARADAHACLVLQRRLASRLVDLPRRLRRGVGEQVPG